MLKLPPLPYAKDALAPHISADTLAVHHGKHHRAYVEKTNKLIEGTAFEKLGLEEIVMQSLTGLIFEPDLEFAEIHGDVAAIGERQRFLDMDQRQSRVAFAKQLAHPAHHLCGFRRQIEAHEDVLVDCHDIAPKALMAAV